VKIRSKKLKQSAKDQECTLNIVDVCSYDNNTTVLCHINVLKDKGFGVKGSDLSAAFGCSNCHEHIDSNRLSELDMLFYTRRAILRTINKWIEMGLIDVVS